MFNEFKHQMDPVSLLEVCGFHFEFCPVDSISPLDFVFCMHYKWYSPCLSSIVMLLIFGHTEFRPFWLLNRDFVIFIVRIWIVNLYIHHNLSITTDTSNFEILA
jgi:hypothetical protein